MGARKIGLKYKLNTASMSAEYNGVHAEGLVLLFLGLPDRAARAAMLEKLAEAHEKASNREATRPVSPPWPVPVNSWPTPVPPPPRTES